MKQILYLFALLAGIFFAWDYEALYPLKVLVVFFHESSHALMTVFTGGKVSELVVTRFQGGHVLSLGGSRFMVLTAGYLGSLAWGAVIYLVGAKTRLDKAAMFILGSIIILITVLYVRNSFALGFNLVTGSVMILSGWLATEKINDFLLRLVGLTSMIYVPLDIYSDTISRSHLRSDARMLAEEFGGTTVMWGGLWLFISVVVIFLVLKWGMKGPESELSGDGSDSDGEK
ncbi:M50 family metallopeptidase [Desulfobacterales bacterium HSG16]|nr:M50 family metallopeptidase [Desulfobacterales bacterium HSG16]